MSTFTIETTYLLPIYRQRSYEADTLDQACRLAIDDEDWDNEKSDVDTAGDTYVTGIWQGADTAYRGTAVAVPCQFHETIERKADHFETLLGILKGLAHAPAGGAADPPFWRQRADAAILKAEAILAGAPDPQTGGDRP